MRAPLRWLRDYVDVAATAKEIAARLNDSGVEVGSVISVGATWDRDKIFVGRVTRIDPHPNADRLTLPTVDYGSGERQVVTGAPNLKVGDKVAFALDGARLFDPRDGGGRLMTLTPAKIRGVESRGMVCSGCELGVSDDHEGILILPADAPVGVPLVDHMGGDTLELDLKPNRADCLAMIGVARQVAALFGLELREPDLGAPRDDRSVLPKLKIEIENPDLCARYSAAYLYDIRVGPSPEWMRQRLEAAGMRSINNIVDVTNFVMLEYGQPLHAFDWVKLRGSFIGVRPARPGESLTTLDGQTRELSAQDLVIIDGEAPVALAGVMGGLESEVSESTTQILLESANFNQTSIRRTSRQLALRSEASRRFEQRLSPETTAVALRRAVQLAEEIGAAKGVDLWGDAYPRPHRPMALDFQLSEIPRLLGVTYPQKKVVDALRKLGFDVRATGAQEIHVTVPYWRGDVSMAADLVEEVASVVGYDTIPATLPTGAVSESVPGEVDVREQLVRDILAGAGYQEAITYTLTSVPRMRSLLAGASGEGDFDKLGRELADRLMPLDLDPIAIVNPLRSEQSVVRLTALNALLETLAANLRFVDRDVALFEVGRIFVPSQVGLPEERRVLTAVCGQRRSGAGWNVRRDVDFFEVKGLGELVLRRLGCPAASFAPFRHQAFAWGRSAAVLVDGRLLGAVGAIGPAVRAAIDIKEEAWALILDLDRTLELAAAVKPYAPLARFPAIVQDLSVAVDLDSRSADLVQAIREAGGELVEDVKLLDEYRGPQVPSGKRGLTYSISYRAAERTLVDEEAAACHGRILKALERRFGAVLRS